MCLMVRTLYKFNTVDAFERAVEIVESQWNTKFIRGTVIYDNTKTELRWNNLREQLEKAKSANPGKFMGSLLWRISNKLRGVTMKTIRFSHEDYEKFRRIQKRPPFTARLLQVFLLYNTDVTDAFREYDTKYYTEQGVEYYSPHGRVWIVLLLETDDGLLFTTMRTASTSKIRYYWDAQGED